MTSNNDSKDTKPSGEINPISVKLAPFWAHSPTIWFVQAEAQFSLARVTADQSKYNYVVSSLPQDIAESIADLLQDPPTTNIYDKLKQTLIERNSLSLERRIKKIISDEEMGDKKPSEFYRSLKNLAGTTGTIGDELIKKLWFQRIPHVINIALIPLKDGALNKLLEVADQVWEALSTSNISSVSESSTSNLNKIPIVNTESDKRYERLEQEISELKQMVSNMASNRSRTPNRNNSRYRSNSFRNRSYSRERSNSRGRLCYYHFKFGELARKCTLPCERNGAIVNNASTSNNSSN